MKKWNCCIVFLLLFAWIIFPAASAGDMNFRMDPQRLGDYSGVSGGFIPNDQLKWKYQTNGAIYSSPSIENNIVYIGSDDGNIYALDAITGAFKWKYPIASPGYLSVACSPAVVDGIVYIGSGDKNLYALDENTGALKWKYPTGNTIRSSPAIVNGVVYFGSWDHYMYALDAATGAFKWKYLTAREVLSSPAVVNGIVYFGSYDNNLYALDADTGAFKWKYTAAGRIYSTPAVLNGIVYVGSKDNNLHVLDADTGAFKWKYPTSGWIDASPTVKDNLVYIGSDDSYLYILDAKTGAFQWKYQTGSLIDSSVAIADGVIYFGSYDSNLYALNANTGAFKWKYKTGNTVYSSPAIVNGVLYFGSVDGFVYAVGNQPVTGSINVISDPPGAQIWIDGNLQSYFTPYTFDGILTGIHAVKVHLDEYIDAENTNVVVAAGKTTLADFQLTALNKPPLSNAGPDQTVTVNTMVTLDGTASSDPDSNTPLTYVWSIQSKPALSTVTLSSTTADKLTFTPDLAGDYVIALTVKDSLGLSSITFDTVSITATNQPPVASAGPDKTVIVNEPVIFDGSGSSDSDGTIVTYAWDFDDSTQGQGITTSHTYTAAGTYTVSLMVTDNDGLKGSDTAIITVKTPAEAVQDLITKVDGFGLPKGIEQGLLAKLDTAEKKIIQKQYTPARNTLNAFINQVSAQREKALTGTQANELIAIAERIINSIPGK